MSKKSKSKSGQLVQLQPIVTIGIAILAIVFLFFEIIKLELVSLPGSGDPFNIFELLSGKERVIMNHPAVWVALILLIAPLGMILVNLLMSKNKKMSTFLSLFLSCLGIFLICVFPMFAKTALVGDSKFAESVYIVYMAIGSIISIVIYALSFLFNGFIAYKLMK